jgi:hypothetical protein
VEISGASVNCGNSSLPLACDGADSKEPAHDEDEDEDGCNQSSNMSRVEISGTNSSLPLACDDQAGTTDCYQHGADADARMLDVSGESSNTFCSKTAEVPSARILQQDELSAIPVSPALIAARSDRNNSEQAQVTHSTVTPGGHSKVSENAPAIAPPMTMDDVVDYLQDVRKKPTVDKDTIKKTKHAANEILLLLSGQQGLPGGAVETNPKHGGAGATWVRAPKRKGQSSRTERRVESEVNSFLRAQTNNLSDEAADRIVTNTFVNNHSREIFKVRRRKILIVPNAEDQGTLQAIGGMSDRRVFAHNAFLASITGFSIHEKKNTLAKVTASSTPDYTVYAVKVNVNKEKIAERYCLAVDSISSVVCDRVMELFDGGLLVTASELTLLGGDTLLVRFLGDKGGHFMASKFGVTVMNCRNPNSPDSFELCAALDAPDSYHNLKIGYFDKFADELEFFFELGIHSPKLFLLLLEGKGLVSFAFSDADDCFDAAWSNKSIVQCDIDSQPLSFGLHSGGPYKFTKDTVIHVLQNEDEAWGIRLLDTGRDGGNVLRFKDKHPTASLGDMECRQFDIHSLLGGDIEFLNLVLGLMTCSASFPYYHCLMQLSTLHDTDKIRQQPTAEARTKEMHEKQLNNVNKEPAIQKKKKVAKDNGSALRKKLVPADFTRVLVAVLHIILGIGKKIFDGLLEDLQRVDDGGENTQRAVLIQVRDFLIERTEQLRLEEETIKNECEAANKRRKDAWANFRSARKARDSLKNIEALKDKHHVALEEWQEAKERSKNFDKGTLPVLLELVNEINFYLKCCRGKYEGILEFLISTDPINAKHNPFYSGSFNGNDIMRLMHNFQRIFDALRKAAEEEDDSDVKGQVHGICRRWEKIFDAFASFLPLFRAARLLSKDERQQLREDIAAFWDIYLKESGASSVILKIHQLFVHALEQLEKYGTLGLFAEDPVESIHAIVNTLARQYAPLESQRRLQQVFRGLQARRTMHSRVQKQQKVDEKAPPKRQRKQGERVGGSESIDRAAMVDSKVVDAATDFLSQVKTAATDSGDLAELNWHFPGLTNLVPCETCRDHLEMDLLIPCALLPLHQLLLHTEVGAKFERTSKKRKKD